MTDATTDAPTSERVRRRRSTQAPRRSLAPLKRGGFAASALLAIGGVAVALAVQPYDPWLPLGLCVALAAVSCRWPSAGIVIALALLPVADLTTWTGMPFLTESDLVVMSAVAGIALRYAVFLPPSSQDLPPSGAYVILISVLLASYALSTLGQLVPFPQLDIRLLAGFGSPFNGLRLAKGAVLGVLLLACVRAEMSARQAVACRAVQIGVLCGTVAVALAALWERLVFVGFTEFAAEYRTTATFWEMHIGGAQLDGWLALASPFVLSWLLRNRNPVVAVLLAIASALILYATLTTFSRGLFAAVALELVILVLLAFGRDAAEGTRQETVRPLLAVVALIVLLGQSAFTVFASGGYRGMLAILASAGLTFYAAPALSRLTIAQGLVVATAGAVTGLGTGMLFVDVPKAIYVAFGMAWIAGAVLVTLSHWRPGAIGLRALAGVAAVAPALIAPQVTAYWHGEAASSEIWLAGAIALSPLVMCRLRKPSFWASTLPANAVAAIGLVGLGAVTAIGQSYFAGTRFATVSQDMAGRTVHWGRGLSLLSTPGEWFIGIGTGRYADKYYWESRDQFLPGSFSLVSGPRGAALSLSPASTPVGWGEIFRVTQRVDADVQGPIRLDVRARVPEGPGALPVLHAQVCRQWLLYNAACLVAQVRLQAGEHDHAVTMGGALGEDSVWGMPIPTQFAMGLDSVGRSAEIVSIRLSDGNGRPLLRNSQFEQGMAWWHFSSERIHLPYHAKNLWLHALIEQGIVGLIAISLFGGLAVLWLAVGPGKSHPLAPACLAALLGFGIVGAFDSLIDAPRLGLMFVFVGGFALSLRGSPPEPTS